jgi:pimeloyl-ACP methyl ester carboxylesterase
VRIKEIMIPFKSSADHMVLEVNGLRFHALAEGPADAELVLFLHGFPEFADAWLNIMHPMAAAGFFTVAVDQRGYSPEARPPNVEDYAMEHLLSDILGFADKLDAGRFHLVAHDWGGLLAWQIAAEHPDRVRSLTVLSTPHTNAFLEAIQTD